ncbi:hypothetical protein EYF80_050619 [Liparis tanakae]|uniref:Uncharacterized protein n=1 Tax=Liparis tanakae TaxID=230148 RepID=A0A4Z2FE98_9TELE|nr:hypothetical protein EYF80_050619 [Liparis tanakae]
MDRVGWGSEMEQLNEARGERAIKKKRGQENVGGKEGGREGGREGRKAEEQKEDGFHKTSYMHQHMGIGSALISRLQLVSLQERAGCFSYSLALLAIKISPPMPSPSLSVPPFLRLLWLNCSSLCFNKHITSYQ